MNTTQNLFIKDPFHTRQKQKEGCESVTFIKLATSNVIASKLSGIAIQNLLKQITKTSVRVSKQQTSSLSKYIQPYIQNRGTFGSDDGNWPDYAETLPKTKEGVGNTHSYRETPSTFAITTTDDSTYTDTNGDEIRSIENSDKFISKIAMTGV